MTRNELAYRISCLAEDLMPWDFDEAFDSIEECMEATARIISEDPAQMYEYLRGWYDECTGAERQYPEIVLLISELEPYMEQKLNERQLHIYRAMSNQISVIAEQEHGDTTLLNEILTADESVLRAYELTYCA